MMSSWLRMLYVVQMNHGFSGGKRNRELERDLRKKEKAERLRRHRASPDKLGGEVAVATPLPEVRLEDIVLGVPPRPKRETAGPVKLFVGGLNWDTTTEGVRA